jgi:hypothetical protein
MPRYVIIEIKEMYYVFSEGEILFKSHSVEACKKKVEALEYFDLLKETMTPY